MEGQCWISMTHCLELCPIPNWVSSLTPDRSCSPHPRGHGHSLRFMAVLLPIHSWVACHHPNAFRGYFHNTESECSACPSKPSRVCSFHGFQHPLSSWPSPIRSRRPLPTSPYHSTHSPPLLLCPLPTASPLVTSASVQTPPQAQGSLQCSFHRGPQSSSQQHPEPVPCRVSLPLCFPVSMQFFYFRVSFL